MKDKIANIKNKVLWYIAIIIEWIIVPFYIAAIGYNFDISWYNVLKSWEYVGTAYYVLACIDITLFGYFVLLYRKTKQDKLMQVSVFCCLSQLILLITKVKY